MRLTLKLPCLVVITAIIALHSGCRHAPRHLAPGFGETCKKIFNRQVLNQEAPEDRKHVSSIPGNVADQIYHKKYIKGLTEEKEEKDDVNRELKSLN